jgi:hypothetical protein
MNRYFYPVTLIFALTTLVLSSCSTDDVDYASMIKGKWELESATRNGKDAASLQGLYFEFDEAGNMDTNLPIAQGASTYQVEGNQITQTNNGQTIVYQVKEVEEGIIMLSATLSNTPFTFTLKKSEQQ